MAWLLLAVIIGLNLGEVYINMLFNQWNADFYNSLQTANKDAFLDALVRFTCLAFTFILVAVYKTYLNQMLRLKWRRWMTQHWLSMWLDKQHYYRMQLIGASSDNPDQRISEDIEQFIQLTLGLSLGLLSSLVTLFSFLTILWGLSGALEIPLFGTTLSIPGYMLWAALIYAVAGTWLTMKIGRPLIRLNFEQQRYEADFRFSLVRLRENSESIAFYGGEAREHTGFMERFASVVDNFWKIMQRQKILTWTTASYHQLAVIFPFVVASPRFFAGQIPLGVLMQTVSAFGQVQGALSYLIDVYSSLATWKSVVQRLLGFKQAIALSDASMEPAEGLIRHEAADRVEAKNLTIRLPNGDVLLSGVELKVGAGDSLLITGASGKGKSTLLRCLAGLWPYAQGTLSLPDTARSLFVSQKPYLPLGTLRQALYYPAVPKWQDTRLDEVLGLCGLSHLKPRLDEVALWSQILSLGEQQRLAFARVLLCKPDFIFLDEATSALDEPAQMQLYGLLGQYLPQSAVVSVGHRESLRQFHKSEKSF